MSERITDRLAKALDAALDQHAGGEELGWDIGMLPSPNGQLLHVFTVVCPSPILGQYMQLSAVIPNSYTVTDDDCDQLVLNLLGQIAAQRSQILADTSNAGNPVLNDVNNDGLGHILPFTKAGN